MGRNGSQNVVLDTNGWTSDQKLLARRLFKLRVHEAKAIEFQRLFEKVMQYRYPNDFLAIKPYGKAGDRKNDGYCPSTGTYHQVFAPERPTASQTVLAAAKKAKVDFAGLKKAWNHATPITTYRFVFNDEYMGCPADVALACTAIANKHGITSRPFVAPDLEDEAMSLAQDQIQDVIHTPIPQPDLIKSVEFCVLNEVIHFVLENPIPVTKDSVLSTPDFTDKIEFNGLSVPVGSLLHTAGRQIEAVEDYFSKNSQFAKQALRDKLSALYLQSRRRFSRKKSSPEYGDLVFFDLLARMVPEILKRDKAYTNAQEAALVVMSFYFESCDVFEAPNAVA